MIRFFPKSIATLIYRLYKRAEIKEPQLRYLFLELTRICNLQCRHCGSDCKTQSSSAELTTDSWLRIINYIKETFSPPPVLVLTGGEPVLHKDFNQIIESINKNNMRFGVVSNGYALNQQKIESLIKNNVYSMTISIDGLQESHNWLRQRDDSFQKAIEAAALIIKSKIPVFDVVTCVNPHNIEELDSIANLLLSIGVPTWRLFRIFPMGRAQNNRELYLDHQQTMQMVEWVRVNKKRLKKNGLSLNLSCEGWLPLDLDLKVRDVPFFCRAGIQIASILTDGTITGCTNNPAFFHQGNITKDNLAYIWKNGFQKFRGRKWIEKTSCGKCRHKTDCNGNSIHLWQTGGEKIDFCYVEKDFADSAVNTR